MFSRLIRNLALVERMYGCFNRDDLNTICNEISASNLVWDLPGHHRLSGTKHGADEALVLFALLHRTNNKVTLSPRNDRPIGIDSFGQSAVIGVQCGRGTLTVRDASGAEQQVTLKPLNWTHYQIRRGRIANRQVYVSDQHAADTFSNVVYQLEPIPDRLA
jgi:uncharacterized protein